MVIATLMRRDVVNGHDLFPYTANLQVQLLRRSTLTSVNIATIYLYHAPSYLAFIDTEALHLIPDGLDHRGKLQTPRKGKTDVLLENLPKIMTEIST